MRRQWQRRAHTNHERWLVSYADFITLLFAFFVVLYASSKADHKKQQQVSQAIDSAFHSLGLFPEPSRVPSALKNVSSPSGSPEHTVGPMSVEMGADVLSPAQVKQDLERIQRQLEQKLANEIAERTVAIKMGKDGLVISLREAGFFSSGSAIPRAATLPVLREIAIELGKTPYDIRIEGHTDNVPIHSEEFDSNWELSSSRATRVARIFLGTQAVAPDRLSAAGYAEFHPVASNDSEDGRAENRRVDVVVLPRTLVNLAMPDADASKGAWKKITQ